MLNMPRGISPFSRFVPDYSDPMKLRSWTFLFPLALWICQAAGENPAPLENGGFEQGLEGWNVQRGQISTAAEAAHAGQSGLRIAASENATINSLSIPIEGAKKYRLQLWIRGLENSHAGATLSFSDGSRKSMDLENADSFKKALPAGKEWKVFSFEFTAPEAALFLNLKLGVWPKKDAPATDTLDIDEVILAEIPAS